MCPYKQSLDSLWRLLSSNATTSFPGSLFFPWKKRNPGNEVGDATGCKKIGERCEPTADWEGHGAPSLRLVPVIALTGFSWALLPAKEPVYRLSVKKALYVWERLNFPWICSRSGCPPDPQEHYCVREKQPYLLYNLIFLLTYRDCTWSDIIHSSPGIVLETTIICVMIMIWKCSNGSRNSSEFLSPLNYAKEHNPPFLG